MYSVTVLTPKGRRHQVKVTPNTTLLQILEEVCTKYGLNAREYELRHHNKLLDVSSMFRFTSLPNNAQLEMIEATKQRQEFPVTLGVQLESGERLTGVFTPSDSVWHVIVTLKPEEEKMDHVVVIYMRQEIYGKDNLSKTTLRSLGLTGGRAILRLLHKSPEELRTQANVTSNLTRTSEDLSKKETSKLNEFKKIETTAEERNSFSKDIHTEKSPKPSSNPPSNPPSNPSFDPSSNPSSNLSSKEAKSSKHTKYENINFKGGNVFEKLLKDDKTKKSLIEERRKHVDKADLKEKTFGKLKGTQNNQEPKENFKEAQIERNKKEMEIKKKEGKVIFLGDRNAIAYNLNNVKPVMSEEEPDDFYDLTINDAKILLKQAKQLCEDLEEAPLMTAAQRELEKDKKVLSLLHQYKKTVLRVKFPDRTVLQGTFSPVETISEVEKFVAGYLEDPQIKFYLYTTPPKVILKPQERLIECGCVPSSILYFGMSADAPVPSQYLKSNVLESLSTPSAAALAAFESRGNRKLPKDKDKVDEGEKRKWTKSQNNPEPGPSGSKQMETVRRDESNSPQFKLPKWFKPNK